MIELTLRRVFPGPHEVHLSFFCEFEIRLVSPQYPVFADLKQHISQYRSGVLWTHGFSSFLLNGFFIEF